MTSEKGYLLIHFVQACVVLWYYLVIILYGWLQKNFLICISLS